MLKNYLKVAFRNLLRQPGYTALNIMGLTVGIASSLIILLYIFHETSFDKHHAKGDHIYRLSTAFTEPDNSFRWSSMTPRAAFTIKNENPEVVQAARLRRALGGLNGSRFEYNQVEYFQENVYAADSTVFELFDYEFLVGNPETALDAPNAIVINESMARKIFKDENPIGQVLKNVGNQEEAAFQVTGVFKDMPKTSHLMAEALVSWETIFPNEEPGWGGWGVYSYIMVNEGVTVESLQVKLDSTVSKYIAPVFDQLNIKVKMVPILLQDIHLKSDFENEPVPAGNIQYVQIFSAIAIFLVLIASINYMNLATARSAKRALEVGVRKVMGAQRSGLITQFITESILITLISLALSILLITLVVPGINTMVGTNLDIEGLLNLNVILAVMGIVFITGFIGGCYPAFFLSSFQPAAVLKGGGKSGGKILRKVLVTLQFSISIFMLIGTMVIYAQMQFVRNKDLGFDKEQIMRIEFRSRADMEKWQVLKHELTQNTNINSIGSASTAPGDGYPKNVFPVETEAGPMDNLGLDNYRVDYDYFSTLGIEVVQGRNFSLDYASDTSLAVMVNEAMVRRMNWTDPIGKKVNIARADSLPSARVVGVVKDFHQRSLYDPITALLFRPSQINRSAIVKITGDVTTTVDFIEAAWQRTFPNTAFEYTFLDEQFLENYEEDQTRGQLFLGFSGMTVLIACLGLLGLASYTAEQRSKEISIRKVLGANTQGLMNLLIRDFVILILIAAVPASVLGYFSMMGWLESFQFHITPGFTIFSTVLVGTMMVTVLTTGYHARKAATANPAQKLRSE